MDQVVACLEAVMVPDLATRQAAEHQLSAFAQQQGFALSLCHIMASDGHPQHIRQMSGVLLRQSINKHWASSSPSFVAPELTDGEKGSLRTALPMLLMCPVPSVARAAGECVSAVAEFDYPEQWPALFDTLCSLLSCDSPFAKLCALRCLGAIDYGTEDVAKVIGLLVDLLPQFYEAHKSAPPLPRSTLKCLHGCLRTLPPLLASLPAVPPSAPSSPSVLLGRVVRAWTPVAVGLLRARDDADPAQCLYMLKSIVCFVREFNAFDLTGFVQALLPILTEALNTAVPMYQSAASEEGEDGDSDGERVDVTAYTWQLLETLEAVAGSHRYAHLLEHHVGGLMQAVGGCMMMTVAQVELFDADPNGYVADEDNELQSYSIRTACECFVNEMLDMDEEGVSRLVVAAAMPLIQAATNERASSPVWWRKYEAGLMMLGLVADALPSSSRPSHADILSHVIAPCLDPATVVYLRARALWALARVLPAVNDPQARAALVPPFVPGVVEALGEAHPLPVRLYACKAVARFAQTQTGAFTNHVAAILNHTASLVPLLTPDTLHLTLDAMVCVLKRYPAESTPHYGSLLPLLLALWIKVWQDPLCGGFLEDAIQALGQTKEGLSLVLAKVFPLVVSVFKNHASQPPGFVERAVRVLQAVVGKALVTEGMGAGNLAVLASMQLCMLASSCEDRDVLTAIVDCLCVCVRDGAPSLRSDTQLVNAVVTLTLKLATELPETALVSVNVGRLSTLLVWRLSDVMRSLASPVNPPTPPPCPVNSVDGLLLCLLHRFTQCKSFLVRRALLHAFMRHAHDCTAAFLAALGGEGGFGPQVKNMRRVVKVWLELMWEGNFPTTYECKLATAALVRVMQSSGHPALQFQFKVPDPHHSNPAKSSQPPKRGARGKGGDHDDDDDEGDEKVPKVYVPCEARIVQVLLREFSDASTNKGGKKGDDGDDGDDDDESDDEEEDGSGEGGGGDDDDDEFEEDIRALYARGFAPASDLDKLDLTDFGHDSDDDEDNEDDGKVDSETMGLDVQDAVRTFMRQLRAHRGQQFAAIAQSLTPEQQQLLGQVLG